MSTAPPVAGVDLLLDGEPRADRLLHDLAGLLVAGVQRAGGDPGTLTLGTHAVEVDGVRRVALSIGTGPVREDLLWSALRSALEAAGTPDGGLVLGSRAEGARELQAGARAAAEQHAARSGGRAVRFPGSSALVGELPVADVLARTAVDRVLELGAGEADPATVLVTRGFVRPRWTGGDLVLHVQPHRGGTLVPFESPDPTPCCADHS